MNTPTKAQDAVSGHPRDPVQVDSPRLQELLDAVGERAFERELAREHPTEAFNLVREYGFGAYRLPRELGGAGASLVDFFGALVRFAAVDSNVAHALRTHFLFVDTHIGPFLHGEDRKWLEQVQAGALFGGATTELGNRNTGGLNADRFQTTVVADGAGYRLNGTKFYATGSLYSDWLSVVGVTPDGAVASVTIPVDRDGVHLEDDWDGIGQQLTASGSARFEEVFATSEEVVIRTQGGHAGGGHGTAMAQLHLTAVIAGILQAATDDAVKVLRGRARTFSHGASENATDDPLLQHIVGQLSTNAFAARAVVLEAARSLDAAADAGLARDPREPELIERAKADAAKAKVLTDELAQRSGWLVFDVAGASATRRGLNLDRHWRNARTLASHNPAIYKSRAMGDQLVNESPLPASALF
jgi:alkylation response protein AidB-like acyl-CoA dehydrogenase